MMNSPCPPASAAIKVSVAITAYNHEAFIRQAMESALSQITDFDYEIVVGEDCSTDNTRSIVVDFEKRYPDRVRAIWSDSNIGANRNTTRTLAACNGQYIALLDGDDYWTSPCKLQRQVDFLDSNPECVICFHNVDIVDKDGRVTGQYVSERQRNISVLGDIIKCNFIPTASVLLRNGLIGGIPDWYYTLGMGDWPLYILSARHGKIGYLRDTMGVYRTHDGGVWSVLSPIKQLEFELDMLEKVASCLGQEYKRSLSEAMVERWCNLAWLYNNDGNSVRAKYCAARAVRMHSAHGCVYHKKLFKVLLKLFAPRLYDVVVPVGRRLMTYGCVWQRSGNLLT